MAVVDEVTATLGQVGRAWTARQRGELRPVAAVLDEVAAALGDLRRVAAVLDEVATAEPLGQACGSDVVGSLGAARAHGDKVCGRVRAAPFLGRRTRSMKNRYEYGSRHWRVFFCNFLTYFDYRSANGALFGDNLTRVQQHL
jgi:hypothetical protein